MEEYLTLILKENRLKVNKEKLASKSCYFASLFSHNFNDSHNKEHVINYDIALYTLQNFVEWIHNEQRVDIYYHSIKVSMTKFLQNNFIELLNLLQLSVLFIVDELINDIIEIIVLCWLLPEKVIDIWLLAQELNIKPLRDICLSVCLDRFKELPLSMLIELTTDNISQLIQNINVRSSKSYLYFVKNKWMKHHTISDTIDIKEEREYKFIKGTVVCERDDSNDNKIANLYIWDNNILCKSIQLKSIQYPEKWINGMQVIGRGFSVYTIGGEVGLEGGQFNEIISRYCLLSNKWYYQAELPNPRRHMIAAFISNKLIIVGGVGKHRVKLRSVDILDIHTGEWKEGAYVPECFTEVPPHCVLNGRLFFLKSTLYIYYPEDNYWRIVKGLYNNPNLQRVNALLTYDSTLFLIDMAILLRIDITRRNSVCKREECLKGRVDHTLLSFVVYKDRWCELRYVEIDLTGIMILNVSEGNNQFLHTEIKMGLEDSISPMMNCFNIIDPHTLYDTV
ncbi:uncharacterized protein LOC102681085 isoform X1 [Apis dorsata]|uniref:uncharacterized protein LOC102681085 isoform X1 n=2 Tax=Apis dorsata TaxID=7462 RepID=UPI0003DF7376|nr:uncharacterized protein LOC102681085 isoform X1 [Apis dorsata]